MAEQWLNFRQNFQISDITPPPPPPFALEKTVFSPLLDQYFRKFVNFREGGGRPPPPPAPPRFPPLTRNRLTGCIRTTVPAGKLESQLFTYYIRTFLFRWNACSRTRLSTAKSAGISYNFAFEETFLQEFSIK